MKKITKPFFVIKKTYVITPNPPHLSSRFSRLLLTTSRLSVLVGRHPAYPTSNAFNKFPQKKTNQDTKTPFVRSRQPPPPPHPPHNHQPLHHHIRFPALSGRARWGALGIATTVNLFRIYNKTQLNQHFSTSFFLRRVFFYSHIWLELRYTIMERAQIPRQKAI